jgi:dTDP-4-dehydrorhamnose reductase
VSSLGKVLLLGSGGQLGVELKRVFAPHAELVPCDRSQVDLAREESLRDIVRTIKPRIILNAAAYTAVDKAESEPELAMAINGVAPAILAQEALDQNALFIHYSTDYVFDGSKRAPWLETDRPAPLNVYGKTKLAGENAVRAIGGKYLIFRTSWVFSAIGHNFLRTILRLAAQQDELNIIEDQIGAPTSSAALANATLDAVCRAEDILNLKDFPLSGIYHMVCEGSTSWYGFARQILEDLAPKLKRVPRINGISSGEYACAALRPKNSILSTLKLRETFSVYLPDWKEALKTVELNLKDSGFSS